MTKLLRNQDWLKRESFRLLAENSQIEQDRDSRVEAKIKEVLQKIVEASI
jgi:hypothetical protein